MHLSQQFDQPETATMPTQAAHDEAASRSAERERAANSSNTGRPDKQRGFDWRALSIVVLIAAIFAVAGRLYAQPPTSLVPVAVLSASGCGLLITALRKMRTSKGVGLPEAAVVGLCIAALQFLCALSYPGVVASLGNEQIAGPGFFTTWALIAIFSVLFSAFGAIIGHLAFAPLRPLPANKRRERSLQQEDMDIGDAMPDDAELPESTGQDDADQQPTNSVEEGKAALLAEVDSIAEREGHDDDAQQAEVTEEEEEAEEQNIQAGRAFVTPQRTTTSYVIAILLLGFIPTLAGYVFAAAFDFMLSHNGYAPGPFPTLRLLSSLLPWQIPDPVGIQGAGSVSLTVSLLWRIPLFFGNSAPFDAQALEPYIFTAAALGLLLGISFRQEHHRDSSRLPRSKIALFEALLGLALVLPADLWMLQGLQGIFQFHNIVLPLGTLRLLDPLTFALDHITGIAICIAIGILAGTRTKLD